MDVSDRVAMRAARWMWARREITHRWRSLVVVGLLAGIAGGLGLAAIAGAFRSETAYSRFRRATAAPDALVFGTQVGAHSVDYSRVLALPEVVDGGEFDLAAVMVADIDGVGKIEPGKLGALPPNDSHLYNTLAQPLLRHGRLPDPARADEITVNTEAARKYHLHVGQHVVVVAAKNLDAFYGAPPVVAVRLNATIVGIGNSIMDAIFSTGEPGFEPSGAFMTRYGNVVEHAPNLVVRLKPGTDVAAFHRRAVRVLRDPQVSAQALLNVPVRDLADDQKRVTHATDLETTGLFLFAATVAFAALVLIGQTIARVVYAAAASLPALRSLGFTRRDSIGALVAPFVIATSVAIAGTIASALAFSIFFPVGLARRFDPSLGMHTDWHVFLPGAAVVAGFVSIGALLAAVRATSGRNRSVHGRVATVRRRILNTAPLPVALGAGLALDGGRGERSLPVRPAITGTIAAIVGIVGALGLVHGIDDALAQPSRSGQIYDAIVSPGSAADFHAFPGKLAKLPQVDEIAHIRHGTADVAGAGLPLWDIEPVRGNMRYSLLSGRAPADGETAIGPSTEHALHLGIGDTVHIAGAHPATVHISGIALLPESPHSSFDQGLWVSPATMRAIFGPVETADTSETFAVTRRPGVALTDLEQALDQHVTHDIDTAAIPQDVLFLRDVRSLPVALSAFLVLLAIAAVGHALATAVRRRRDDLAVLRALGFRPRQSALCIAALAATVAVIGLVVGLPLGVALGQLAWHWVATRTPLLYVAPLATVALVVCIPATFVIANALAAIPARRAARIPTAAALRTE